MRTTFKEIAIGGWCSLTDGGVSVKKVASVRYKNYGGYTFVTASNKVVFVTPEQEQQAMREYTVELTAKVEVTRTVTVFAENEADAEALAIRTAPTQAKAWNFVQGQNVTDIEGALL